MIKNDCQRDIIGFLGRTRYNKSKSGEKQEGKDMEFNAESGYGLFRGKT